MSVILITSDNTIILGHHSPNAIVAPNTLDVASSGGASIPLDANKDPLLPQTFTDLITYGVRKELFEETHHPYNIALTLDILTVYRQISRGGKPHIITITRTPLASSDLAAGDDVAHLTALPLGSDPHTRITTILHYLAQRSSARCTPAMSDNLRIMHIINSSPDAYLHASALLRRHFS
jgi:hypothetical protein